MKKAKVILMIMIIAIFMTACEGEYRDVKTKYSEDYVYSMGEKIEFLDKETDKVVALLTVDSCELVEDTPFIVKRELKTYTTDSDGNEEIITEWKETEYTALYEVSVSYDSVDDSQMKAGSHFSSEEVYFEVNPLKGDSYYNKFYIGAKKGNDGDGVVTVNFNYFHYADHVMVNVELDEIVSEESTAEPRVITITSGKTEKDSEEENTEKTEQNELYSEDSELDKDESSLKVNKLIFPFGDAMLLICCLLCSVAVTFSIIFFVKWRNLKNVLKKNGEKTVPIDSTDDLEEKEE